MKGTRTKAQEIINELWGVGVYKVREEDLPKLVGHFKSILPELLEKKYLDVILAYFTGGDVGNLERQLKHHALQNLRKSIRFFPDAEPTFLERVELPDDGAWSKAALGEVLYGEYGDPKIYIADIPDPKDGKAYTKREVQEILTTF